MKRLVAKILVSLVSTLLCLALLECAVRVMTRRDPDGDITFHGLRLKPIHPPVEKARALLAEYEKDKAHALMTYDADLGWRPTPAGSGGNRDCFASLQPNPGQTPQPGRLRIELFGGSYTRGRDGAVAWWSEFDKDLNAQGVNAEVFNFGIAGTAIDQAFLRWKRDGVPYHPDIVIFGFCPGNIMDDLNIVRMVQNPDSGIPFTKPRFILENDALKLVNSPTVAPDDIVSSLAGLKTWPLLKYDHYYDPENYQWHWWQASRLAALVQAKREFFYNRAHDHENYTATSEGGVLGLKIIQQFRAEVEASGSKFFVIHLPSRTDLEYLQAHHNFPYQSLYDALRVTAPVIQTEQNLMQVIGSKPVPPYFIDDHYGDDLNRSIGATTAGYIADKFPKPPAR